MIHAKCQGGVLAPGCHVHTEAVRSLGEMWFEQRVIRPTSLLPLAEQGAELIFSTGGTCHVDIIGPEERSGIAEHEPEAPAIGRPGTGEPLGVAGQQVTVAGTDLHSALTRERVSPPPDQRRSSARLGRPVSDAPAAPVR